MAVSSLGTGPPPYLGRAARRLCLVPASVTRGDRRSAKAIRQTSRWRIALADRNVPIDRGLLQDPPSAKLLVPPKRRCRVVTNAATLAEGGKLRRLARPVVPPGAAVQPAQPVCPPR